MHARRNHSGHHFFLIFDICPPRLTLAFALSYVIGTEAWGKSREQNRIANRVLADSG